MLDKLWLIPIVPFIGFLLNGLLGRKLGKSFVTLAGCGASLLAALLGTAAVVQYTAASC
jgi:NADH-quinone oxidoreductase subunit L